MEKSSLMIKVMLTNITLIVNEWQHSNFRKALTRNFTQPLTLNAISSMITSNAVTRWQKAVKHLQWRIKNPFTSLRRGCIRLQNCAKGFSLLRYMCIFLKKKCGHVTAVSLTHINFFIFVFSPCFFLAKRIKIIHLRAWSFTLSLNK